MLVLTILVANQVPGADFDGFYGWKILFWYGSTVAVIAGTHILICTIFLSVFGQVRTVIISHPHIYRHTYILLCMHIYIVSTFILFQGLALRGPLGSMVQARGMYVCMYVCDIRVQRCVYILYLCVC